MAKPKIGSLMPQTNALNKFLPTEDVVQPSVPAGKKKTADGLKGYTHRMRPEALKQLKQISLNEETTIKALMDEALNLLFINKRLPPSA